MTQDTHTLDYLQCCIYLSGRTMPTRTADKEKRAKAVAMAVMKKYLRIDNIDERDIKACHYRQVVADK